MLRGSVMAESITEFPSQADKSPLICGLRHPSASSFRNVVFNNKLIIRDIFIGCDIAL